MKKWIAGVNACFPLFNFGFTLREGERVFRSPHPPRSGPPSPRGATAGAVLTSSTTNVVPLPLIGEGLSALQVGRDLQCRTRPQKPPGNAALAAIIEDSPHLCYPVSGPYTKKRPIGKRTSAIGLVY